MAYKKQGTASGTETKFYFWHAGYLGNGMSRWLYVTTDTPAVVEVSGYFDDAELEAVVKPGDELRVIQVAALDDSRTIQDDIAAGYADESEHRVVSSDGSGLNITPDLLSATITYTS
jgi:hypothetical protein